MTLHSSVASVLSLLSHYEDRNNIRILLNRIIYNIFCNLWFLWFWFWCCFFLVLFLLYKTLFVYGYIKVCVGSYLNHNQDIVQFSLIYLPSLVLVVLQLLVLLHFLYCFFNRFFSNFNLWFGSGFRFRFRFWFNFFFFFFYNRFDYCFLYGFPIINYLLNLFSGFFCHF